MGEAETRRSCNGAYYGYLVSTTTLKVFFKKNLGGSPDLSKTRDPKGKSLSHAVGEERLLLVCTSSIKHIPFSMWQMGTLRSTLG